MQLKLCLLSAQDVLNHNIETVARLQREVRPSAGYARSLSVLARASAAGLVTKSGFMLGLVKQKKKSKQHLSTLQQLVFRS